MKKGDRTIISRVVILTIYLCVGGAIFRLFEKSHQAKLVKEYKATLDSFMKKYNISEVDMKAIENKIIHSGGKHTMNTEWNYGNAVFFAGTTILTVGYGNIVPKTIGGKVFCMLYALFGIPFTCLALKSLGERFMNIQISLIKIYYKKLHNQRRVASIHLKATLLNFFLTIIVILVFGAMTLLKRKDWSYFEGIYFIFITFTTIGFGDYVPVYEEGFTEFDIISLILGVFIGFSLVSSLLCSVSAAIEEYGVKKVIERAKTRMTRRRGRNANISDNNTSHMTAGRRTEQFSEADFLSVDDLHVALKSVTLKRNSFQLNGIEIDELVVRKASSPRSPRQTEVKL